MSPRTSVPGSAYHSSTVRRVTFAASRTSHTDNRAPPDPGARRITLGARVDLSPGAISAFLLKHPPGDFARGDLIFAPAIGLVPLVVAVLLAAAVTWFAVSRLRRVGVVDRLVLGAIRTAVFLLIGLCLLRPTLVLSRALAQRNVLAVLLDDTRSMGVVDVDGASRLAAVQGTFADSSELMRRLGEKFSVRLFRASTTATPTGSAAALTGLGSRTDLAGALGGTLDALADLPLAGIVLVSDGAQNGPGDLDAELLRLTARQVPVHTVGVGTAAFARDIGIDALRLPKHTLRGGAAPGEVLLRLGGVGGERAVMSTISGGRLVAVDTLELPRDRQLLAVPLRVPAVDPGIVPVEVRIAPLRGEVTALNNSATAVVAVRDGPEKILYVEGEPRPELPFLRRAVATDSALQVVALIRTARGKHLRLGVDDSTELVLGFPARREELFRYRAIVLGSVEAGYFTADQLRMLQEFVTVRGGGLLALGGRRALGEGGYAGTPLDDVLPMQLDVGVSGRSTGPAVTVAVLPTPAGREHPALALPSTGATSWEGLPMLSTVNAPGRLRPGATVLLEARSGTATVPALAVQRYGRGKAGIFLPQDAWRWQLTDKLPETDLTHAAFWDRILRWTVDAVPEQLELEVEPALSAPSEPVELRARVTDSSFAPRDDARVRALVIPPDAAAFELPLEGDLARAGEYVGTFTPTSAGQYRVELIASRGVDSSFATALVLSDPDRGDPGPVERNDAVLSRIAERTGGRHYAIDGLATLPDDVLLTRSGVTARESSDLWDAPLVFLLFLLLLGADWSWRRARGLA